MRRPDGALVAGNPSPAASRQVATDESGDRSPHSKTLLILSGGTNHQFFWRGISLSDLRNSIKSSF